MNGMELNRRGHTYAAKWLWNRLITGPRYNVSNVPLSEESYFCPSLVCSFVCPLHIQLNLIDLILLLMNVSSDFQGCPYFRTPANLRQCTVLTKSEYERLHAKKAKHSGELRGKKHIRENIVLWIALLVFLSTMSVLFFGTIFYRHGMKATKGRFEMIPGV